MRYNLRKYQIEGINKIRSYKNFGLFWQQRLGKTIVAILSVQEYKKVIFAVPNNMVLYWYKEITENIDGIDCVLLPKNKKNRLKLYDEFNQCEKKWIVGSYDTLSVDILSNKFLLNQFDYLVVDESHFLRNRKSKRSKGIFKLREQSNYCLALTGTPAVNASIDILRIFRLIYNDKKYGNKYYYKNKYFNTNKVNNKVVYTLNEAVADEWKKFISKLCDIKNVHDHLKWLPRSIEKKIFLEMHDDQMSNYKKMLIESRRLIDNDLEKHETRTITQIMRLRQICLDPKLLSIQASSIKVEWLQNYIDSTLEEKSEERIIVFTNFTSLFKCWNFRFNNNYKYEFLTGDTPVNEREEIIKDFQDGKIHVLFANIHVAGLGITLDRATISIFLEQSWNPVDNEQAAFRMIDTKEKELNEPKLLIYLICNNSIDEKVAHVLNKKKEETNMVYELKRYILS